MLADGNQAGLLIHHASVERFGLEGQKDSMERGNRLTQGGKEEDKALDRVQKY